METAVNTSSKLNKSKLIQAIRDTRAAITQRWDRIGFKLYGNGGIETYINGEAIKQVTPCEGEVIVDVAFAADQVYNKHINEVLLERFNEKQEAATAAQEAKKAEVQRVIDGIAVNINSDEWFSVGELEGEPTIVLSMTTDILSTFKYVARDLASKGWICVNIGGGGDRLFYEFSRIAALQVSVVSAFPLEMAED